MPQVDAWTTDVTTPAYTLYNAANEGIGSSSIARQQIFGLEATASGNGYIYTAWVIENTGSVYFSRSANSGLTWDSPTLIYSAGATLRVQTCAITAVGANVYIIYNDSLLGDLFLASNSTSGAGAWTTQTIFLGTSNYEIFDAAVAVDPTATNYVNVIFNYYSSHLTGAYAYTYFSNSSNGGATWNHLYYYWSSGYGSDLIYGAGGTLYALRVTNTPEYFRTSTDHGATYVNPPTMSHPNNWGHSGDLIGHPTTDNTVFMTFSTCGATAGTYMPTCKVYRTTDAMMSWTQITNELEDDIEVNDVYEMPMQPSIAFDDDLNLYVAFTFNLYSDPTDYDIYVAKSCDSGMTFGDCYKMNPDSTGYDVNPHVVMDPTSGVVLTWLENGYNSTYGYLDAGGYIRARHVY
jgi:hypothetical protein